MQTKCEYYHINIGTSSESGARALQPRRARDQLPVSAAAPPAEGGRHAAVRGLLPPVSVSTDSPAPHREEGATHSGLRSDGRAAARGRAVPYISSRNTATTTRRARHVPGIKRAAGGSFLQTVSGGDSKLIPTELRFRRLEGGTQQTEHRGADEAPRERLESHPLDRSQASGNTTRTSGC